MLYNNKSVSVFTKNGQFATSFGNGHITYPYGVVCMCVVICCYLLVLAFYIIL